MKLQWASKIRPTFQKLFQTAATKINNLCYSIMGLGDDSEGSIVSSNRHWHNILARLMVVIAILGAIVSGLTAIAENEGERIARQLTQGYHLGLSYRQELLTDTAMRTPLALRTDVCKSLGKQYLNSQKWQGLDSPEAVALLDLHAQEEFAVARTLKPFLAVLPNYLEKGLSFEESLQKRTASYLANRGFKTLYSKIPIEKVNSSKLIWSPLQHDLHSIHGIVPWMTFGVLLFVAAMILLTLSDMRRSLLWKRRFLYSGVLIACLTMGMVLVSIYVHDFFGSATFIITQSWPLLLSQLLLLGLLGFALLDLIKVIRAPSTEEEQYPGGESENIEPMLPEPPRCVIGDTYSREGTSSFSRGIIFMIAITVFCTALCGYWYSRAATGASTAANEAVEDLLEMHTRHSRLNAMINSAMLSLANIQEYRTRFAAVRQLKQYVQDSPKGSSNLAMVHAETYKFLAEDKYNFLEDQYYGIEADSRFPQRLKYKLLIVDMNLNWWKPFALWDAHSQRSLAYHRQACVFLSILTVLAMTIYLFGQGHSMGKGPAAQRLIVYGKVLLLITMGLALCTQVWQGPTVKTSGEKAEDRPENKAAEHYALAMAISKTAHSREEYQKVVQELQSAVEECPDFTLAYFSLAEALAKFGSSQVGESYMNLPTKAAIKDIINIEKFTLKKLKAFGYDEPLFLLSSLGYNSLLLALENKSLSAVRKNIALFQRALTSGCDGGNPDRKTLINWNLGIAQLAARERPTANIEALASSGMDPSNLEDLIVSGFTDLEIVAKFYRPLYPEEQISEILKKNKEGLIAAWPKSVSTAPERESALLKADQVTIEVSAHDLRWRGQLPDFDRQRDRLFMVWYAFDSEWDVWRALPEVSGPVNNARVKNPQASWQEITLSFLRNTGYKRCLSSGRYKAELYINGKLISTSPATMNHSSGFKGVSLFDLNMGLCRPEKWKAIEIPKQIKDRGILMRGFQTQHGKPAVMVFTFYAPRSASGGKIIDQVKTLLAQTGHIAGTEEFLPYESGSYGLQERSSTVLYKHWITAEGVQHVGVAFTGAAPWHELGQTLDSMTNRYQ